jgi:hypothetical protein
MFIPASPRALKSPTERRGKKDHTNGRTETAIFKSYEHVVKTKPNRSGSAIRGNQKKAAIFPPPIPPLLLSRFAAAAVAVSFDDDTLSIVLLFSIRRCRKHGD